MEKGKTRIPVIFDKETSFRDRVVESVGEEIFACYQCYKCSAGCPVSFAMDILPHQVIRSVLFGQKKKVLSSKTIWICASCETCTTRCPNEIDIAKTIFRTMASMGVIFPSGWIKTLKATYLRTAQDTIAKYSHDSEIDGRRKSATASLRRSSRRSKDWSSAIRRI